MTTIARRFSWDAAHRVTRHESKCRNLHGHRYEAEVVVRGPLDPLGRVVDFSVLKDRVGGWLDATWDHGALLAVHDAALLALVQVNDWRHYVLDGEPTAENLARELLARARSLLSDTGIEVVSVRVWETANCWAEESA